MIPLCLGVFKWAGSTASLQFRWLAQPLPHGLFVEEILVFLLFRGKLIKHANHGMRQDAVVAELHIDSGADINAKMDYGYSALHFAVSSEKEATVRMLLKRKANVNVKANDGVTLL